MKIMIVWRTVPGKYRTALEAFLRAGGPVPTRQPVQMIFIDLNRPVVTGPNPAGVYENLSPVSA